MDGNAEFIYESKPFALAFNAFNASAGDTITIRIRKNNKTKTSYWYNPGIYHRDGKQIDCNGVSIFTNKKAARSYAAYLRKHFAGIENQND